MARSGNRKATATRRDFLQTTGAIGALGAFGVWSQSTRTLAQETKNPVERPLAGCIGNGGMGGGDARAISRYADIVAYCDVDRGHAEGLKAAMKADKAEIYEDYRKLLDRKDISLVTISTPDHWHTRIALAALRAGKDVYCQKPLTLTIAEGQLLARTVKETGRTLQVGTQQRSDQKFQQAVGLCQDGRIGTIKKVTVAIGGAPGSGPFKTSEVPAGLNWEMWLGQAPLVDFIKQRCHGDFRWWYEYSGGKMTDWGAHHVDIATWAIGQDNTGPTTVEVVSVDHPVKFEAGWPTAADRFNAATKFAVKCTFPNGVEMMIRDRADDLGFDNGIMFEGTDGRFFVNRGKLTGEAVEAMAQKPLPEELMTKLRKGQKPDSHMGNFVRCVNEKAPTISDVYTHHRALTTCHLANIAMRLGRTIKWDAQTEQILGDEEASRFISREQRKGYETV